MVDYKVEIDGTEYTKNAVMPFKFEQLLDEQLDWASLTLVKVGKQCFAPNTKVKITITSATEKAKEKEQEKILYYIVAKDEFRESPVGSGLYRHELTLIEPTKLLEGYQMESLCVTNPGKKTIKKGNVSVTATETSLMELVFPHSLESPAHIGDCIYFPHYKKDLTDSIYYSGNIYVVENGIRRNAAVITTSGLPSPEYFIIKNTGTIMVDADIKMHSPLLDNTEALVDMDYSFSLVCLQTYRPLKPWTIKSVIQRLLELVEPQLLKPNSGSQKITTGTIEGDAGTSHTIKIKADQQIYSATIVSVKEGLQDVPYGSTIEINGKQAKITWNVPGEKPDTMYFCSYIYTTGISPQRLKLIIPDEKKKIFDQVSPEFTFTRVNLREALKQIGGFIHAEPRLTVGDSGEFDTITFDFYGEQEYATYYDVNDKTEKRLCEYNYESLSGCHDIEQACNEVDAYVDNLVNRISVLSAPTGQPYAGGVQTLRGETTYARFDDANMFLPTAEPIMQIVKLSFIDGDGQAHDITPYVYEKSIYDSQLSSYTKIYPTSKAYALYYTQGQSGISGFWFKRPNAVDSSLETYALINILNMVDAPHGNPTSAADYGQLKFELLYIPIYSARISANKQYIGDWLPQNRSISSSQGNNMVEVQYFGENLKGLAERLGTIEKVYTFTCFNLDTIPKAGTLWDDDFYISTVSVEVMKNKFKVSCGLSKNFNRLSQYIGVNSYKRIYEVSERMVSERQSMYKDYLIITDFDTQYVANDDFLLSKKGVEACTKRLLYVNENAESQKSSCVSCVWVRGLSKNWTAYGNKVVLPVIASAFGNAVQFTWKFKDNFSAGMRAVYQQYGDVSGYFGHEVEYADYFGRMYYEQFALLTDYNETDFALNFPRASSYPNADNLVGGTQADKFETPKKALLKRKDNREALKENYGVEYVTDKKNIVIGSAIASKNPLVMRREKNAKLYILKSRLNKLSRYLDLSSKNIAYSVSVTEDIFQQDGLQMSIRGALVSNDIEGKSWAYAIPKYYGSPYEVEDEDGKVEEIKDEYGGELLFGANEDIHCVEGTEPRRIGAVKIIGTHDVYEYLKAKKEQGGNI